MFDRCWTDTISTHELVSHENATTLWKKRQADIWTHFVFDVKKKKTLFKPCEATLTGKNTANFAYYNLMISSTKIRLN